MPRQRPILVAIVLAFAAAFGVAPAAGAAAAGANPSVATKKPQITAASMPKFRGLPVHEAWVKYRVKGDQVLVDVKTSGSRVTSNRTALDLFRQGGGNAVQQLSAAQKKRLADTPLDRQDARLQIISAAPAGATPTAASLSDGSRSSSTSSARAASTSSAAATEPSVVPPPATDGTGVCNPLVPTSPTTNRVSNCNFSSLTVSQVTSGSTVTVTGQYDLTAARGCPTFCGEIPKVIVDFLDAKFGATQAGVRNTFTESINRLPTQYGTWTGEPNCVGCELTLVRWIGRARLPAAAGAVSDLNVRGCYRSGGYYASNLQPAGIAQFWNIKENGTSLGNLYSEDVCYRDASVPLNALPNDTPIELSNVAFGPTPEQRLGPGNAATPNVTKCSAGDPVDCATGNMYESATDLAVAGRGLGLNQTRTYNAQGAAQSTSGTMGYGWTAPYTDAVVVNAATQSATVVQADGSSVPFKRATDGTYSADPWILAKLKGDASSFTYTLPDQRTMRFNAAGRLLSIADEQGNTTVIGRDTTGRVNIVTDPAGRKLTYTYDTGGRIKTVTDPIGRKVTYDYDAQGNLITVTKPDGAIWRYGYDAAHLLTSRTDPRGNKTTSVYDAQKRVVSQTDAMGRNRKWSYRVDADGRDETTITEPNDSITVETFLNGQPTRIVRAKGTADETTKVIRYNAGAVKSRVTDANGRTTSLLYDAAGNLTTVLAPSGTTRVSYDQLRRPTTLRMPSGISQTMEYDAAGNVVAVTKRSADKTESQRSNFEYDGRGQLMSSIDPLGRKTTYAYNEAGDRTATTTPLGHRTTFTFDGASRMTSRVSANGNAAGSSPDAFRTTWTLDPEGRPTSMTDPLGRIARAAYDAMGNPTSTVNGEGRTTTYGYNKANERVLVDDPASAQTRTEYDSMGAVVKRTDPNGHATTYEYDALGRKVAQTDAKGRTKRYAYDAVGNLIRTTDAAGRTIERTYDEADRVSRIEHSTGRPAPITLEYDEDGRRTKYGNVATTYDSLGRTASTSNGASGDTAYTYDAADQLTAIIYPQTIVDKLLGTGLTVTHAHDADGRTTQVATSRGHKTSYTYDAEGQATTVARPDNGTERRTYDAAGQLLTLNDATSNGYSYVADHKYSRTGQNELTDESANQSGSKLTYAYDAASRLASNGRGASYAYDPAGNATTLATQGLGSRLLGDLAPSLNLGGYDQVRQQFNEVNELVATTSASPLGESSTFRYDAMGQRLARASKTAGVSAGTTSYLWDQAGRLLNVDDSATNASSSYTYDDTGLRATQSNLQLLPNAWNRSSGMPLQLSDGNALYVHGPDGLPLLSYKAGLITRVYHHDAQGSTRAITTTNGTPVARYSYDAYGALNGSVEVAAATNPFLYRGQYTDGSTGLQYLRARYYDPRTGQFLSRDPVEDFTGTPYSYANGDPVNEADPTGLFLGLGHVPILDDIDNVAGAARDIAVDAGQWAWDHRQLIAGIGVGAICVGPGGVACALATLAGGAYGAYGAGKAAARCGKNVFGAVAGSLGTTLLTAAPAARIFRAAGDDAFDGASSGLQTYFRYKAEVPGQALNFAQNLNPDPCCS